jgi:hypothetical protein
MDTMALRGLDGGNGWSWRRARRVAGTKIITSASASGWLEHGAFATVFPELALRRISVVGCDALPSSREAAFSPSRKNICECFLHYNPAGGTNPF